MRSKSRQKAVLLILALLSAAVVLTACKNDGAAPTGAQQSATPAASGPPTEASGDIIEATMLAGTYDKDPDKAKELYTDKTVSVHGMVIISTIEMEDFVAVELAGDAGVDTTSDVKCYFSRKANPDEADRAFEVETGDFLTVSATCKGLMDGNVILLDCTILKHREM